MNTLIDLFKLFTNFIRTRVGFMSIKKRNTVVGPTRGRKFVFLI